MMIRRMQLEDLEQVAQLEAENFSVPWTEQDFRTYLERAEGIFLVCDEEGSILGYCGVIAAPPEGDITNVSVQSKARGRGTGRRLVEEMIRQAEAEGIHTLFLEVRKTNEAAIRLYKNQGFKEVGLRKNYYEKPVEDALIMVREP